MKQHYRPREIIAADEDFKAVMHLLESGYFNQFEKGLFDPVIHSITSEYDPWLTAADFRSFIDAQQRVDEAYRDTARWTRMSIINAATSGKFSTDRTMQDYNESIWKLAAVAPATRD
jgi:starch phosphorylase